MRGDHAVAVGRVRVGRGPAVAEADVEVGLLLVGEVALGVQPERVDAVLAVAAGGVARRREAPVAVAGVLEAVLALGAHVQRVVDAPAARGPLLLRHEDGRHELLEHASAPTGHDVHAAVGVGALVDVDPQVGAGLAHRLHLVPRPVAGRREGAPRREVVLARHLAGEDAEVARDARLGHDRVVVVGGQPDVVATDVRAAVDAARSVVVEDVEAAVHQPAGAHGRVAAGTVAGVVEGVPAHPVEQLGGEPAGGRGRRS